MHNKRQNYSAVFAAAGLMLLLSAQPALAQAIGADGTVCPGNGLVERIATCIENTTVDAVTLFLLPFSMAIAGAVGAVCSLSVVFFGMRLIAGRQQRIRADGVFAAIKIAAVLIFSFNFGGMFPTLMAIMQELTYSVSNFMAYTGTLQCPFAFSVWQRVDCVLDRIIGGIMPGSTLAYGLLGMLFGMLFSGATGVMIFMTGMGFLYMVLSALCKSIYIYLSAMIGICIMAIISPLFVPMILFRVTKPYFDKWLRLLLGLMLQPVFLIAYLSMLLVTFDVVVFTGPNSLYGMIAGPAVDMPNFRVGNYMLGSGAYVEYSQLANSVNFDPSGMPNPPLQNAGAFGNIGKVADGLGGAGGLSSGANVSLDFPVDAVDISVLAALRGMDTTTYTIYVIMGLLQAFVIGYIFLTMLDFVPYLGTTLSSEIMSLPDLGKGFDSGINKFRDRFAGGGEGGGGQGAPEGKAPAGGRAGGARV